MLARYWNHLYLFSKMQGSLVFEIFFWLRKKVDLHSMGNFFWKIFEKNILKKFFSKKNPQKEKKIKSD